MNRLILLLPLIVFLSACHPGKQWKRDEIDKKYKALMDEANQGKRDTTAASKLLANCLAYADAYPSDTVSADYLFKAGDCYYYLHEPQQSINVYARIFDNYPTLTRRSDALFLQGFLYENELKNLSAARAKYQQFLDTYPNLPFATQVRITLNNLGKSPEELVHEFEEKQREDSIANTGKAKQ